MMLTSQQNAQQRTVHIMILMLHCHSSEFNFTWEMKEGTDFCPMTQIKCNEEKNKILYWITCFPSFSLFFPPKHFTA